MGQKCSKDGTIDIISNRIRRDSNNYKKNNNNNREGPYQVNSDNEDSSGDCDVISKHKKITMSSLKGNNNNNDINNNNNINILSLEHRNYPHRHFFPRENTSGSTTTNTNNNNNNNNNIKPRTKYISSAFVEFYSPEDETNWSFGGDNDGFLSVVSAHNVQNNMILCAGESRNICYINYSTGHIFQRWVGAHGKDINIITKPMRICKENNIYNNINNNNSESDSDSIEIKESHEAQDIPNETPQNQIKISRKKNYNNNNNNNNKIESQLLRLEDKTGIFYTASRDCTAKMWQIGEKDNLMIYKGHTLPITAIDVNPLDFGQTLVTGSRDNTVRLWSSETGKCINSKDVKLNVVHFVKYIPAMGLVAQGGEDLTVRLWDIRCSSSASLDLIDTIGNFDYHPICCDAVSSSFDFPEYGDPVGSSHNNNNDNINNINNNNGEGLLSHSSSSSSSSSSTIYRQANDNILYTGHNGFNQQGSMITEWDLRMPSKALQTLYGHGFTVRSINILRSSAQGKLQGGLVSVSDDGSMKLWNPGAREGDNNNNNNIDNNNNNNAVIGVENTKQNNNNNNNSKKWNNKCIDTVPIPEGRVSSITETSSGKLLLSLTNGSILVITTGAADATPTASDRGVFGVRYRYIGSPYCS